MNGKELKNFEIRSFAWMILFFVLFISLIAVSFYLISQEGNKNTVGKAVLYSGLASICFLMILLKYY